MMIIIISQLSTRILLIIYKTAYHIILFCGTPRHSEIHSGGTILLILLLLNLLKLIGFRINIWSLCRIDWVIETVFFL